MDGHFCPRGWAIKISIRFPRELSQPFLRPPPPLLPSSVRLLLLYKASSTGRRAAHGTAEDPLCYNFL